MKAQDVLRTFAALSGSGPPAKTDVTNSKTFTWLTYEALGYFEEAGSKSTRIRPFTPARQSGRDNSPFHKALKELVAKAALHPGEQLIQLGWLWFAGTVEVDSEPTQFCFPAATIRMDRTGTSSGIAGRAASALLNSTGLGELTFEPTGDADMTPLIKDDDVRDRLLGLLTVGDGKLADAIGGVDALTPFDNSIIGELTDLKEWASMVADAVGLEIDTFADRSRSPTADRAKAGISVHVGCGLYLDAPASRGSRKSSLISMSNIDDLSNTAFSKIYSGTPIG